VSPNQLLVDLVAVLEIFRDVFERSKKCEGPLKDRDPRFLQQLWEFVDKMKFVQVRLAHQLRSQQSYRLRGHAGVSESPNQLQGTHKIMCASKFERRLPSTCEKLLLSVAERPPSEKDAFSNRGKALGVRTPFSGAQMWWFKSNSLNSIRPFKFPLFGRFNLFLKAHVDLLRFVRGGTVRQRGHGKRRGIDRETNARTSFLPLVQEPLHLFEVSFGEIIGDVLFLVGSVRTRG
jgi:hypothetical protein